MLRPPLNRVALVLSLAGIVGQVMLHLIPNDGSGIGLLWIAVGNTPIGIILGMRIVARPFPTDEAVSTAPLIRQGRAAWAPAGLALAVQATAGVVLGIYFVSQGSDTLVSGSVVGVLVAAGAIFGGVVVALLLVWPVVVIVRFLVAMARHVLARRAGRAEDFTNERPMEIRALLSAMVLLVIGFATFGVTAVTESGSGSSSERQFAQIWGALFDFSPTGPVDQPLAWGARVCAVAIVAVFGLMVAFGIRLEKQMRPQKP